MVEVIYDGNLGNNLFQYCFGRVLATQLGYKLAAVPLPGFPRTHDKVEGHDYSRRNVLTLRGQKPDLTGVMAGDVPRHLVLTGYFQRYEYYEPYATRIREWLMVEDHDDTKIDPDHVVLSIRRGRDYIPRYGLPLSYYEAALSSMRYNRVFICTNEPNDPFIRYLQRKYRAEVRAGSFQGGRRQPDYWTGALDNLTFIRRFSKIVISNSSFAWWAAFLSDADQIVFPRPATGMWSSTDPVSKDISLEVNESRYAYLACEPYKSEFLTERVKNQWDRLIIDVKGGIKTLLRV